MAPMDKATFLEWLKDRDIKLALQNNNEAIDLMLTYTKKINERFHLLEVKVNWVENKINEK